MKYITVILAIVGAGFTLAPWAKVPFLGEINGLQNGSGMFSLLAFSVILIITLSSKNIKTVKMVNSLLSAIALVGYIIYYKNISQAQQAPITVWGFSVGNMEDVFRILPGFYWECVIVSIMFLINLSALINGNDESEEIIHTEDKELSDVQ